LETNIKPTFFQNIVEVFHSYCGTLLRWNSELSDKVRCKNGKIIVLNEVEVDFLYIVFTEK